MTDSLSNGHRSPRSEWSDSCSFYCSLGTRWKKAQLDAGLPTNIYCNRSEDFCLPQPCYSAMRAKAKRLLKPSGIVWTMARTRRKQKAESISPLTNVIRSLWQTSSFWQKPTMPLWRARNRKNDVLCYQIRQSVTVKPPPQSKAPDTIKVSGTQIRIYRLPV